ncbi:DNA polymerase III subunit delta [Acanthopleuribacter pedis]|uniref:DNA polymerase III subunit delta n=1 Tax=Acanthopleuribacter pedis TaxID=442870 RepID=A0A8J7U7C0_9BACT|nr:DNA polymerase III subunit delta [Acanthopleuribacter pedis]MBO1322844.1 DNA polymerase III subunit delta [Acanthopleuribacter pedis]
MSNQVLREEAKTILSGKVPGVYILAGEELWSRGRFVDFLKKNLVDPSLHEFNFEQVSATTTSAIAVADKAGMLPMMADRRLILVEDCERWLAKDFNAMAKYLDSICESTCLVLLFPKIDKRRKLFTKKSPLIRTLEFPRPKPWELPEFIAEVASGMKLNLSREALAMVAELAGDDLPKVHRELDKLSIFKMDSGKIEAADVAALMGRTRPVTRWELGGLIGKRNLHAALVKAHDIMASGEDVIGLLSAVNMVVKQLFVVKTCVNRGIRDQYKVAKMVGVPPKIAADLLAQQRNYSISDLKKALQLIRDADYRAKSSAVNRHLIIDHLLCQMMQREPKKAVR